MKISKVTKWFLPLFWMVLSSTINTSCSVAYRTLLGIDIHPNWVSSKQINKKAKRYGIPENQIYVLKEGDYIDSVISKSSLEAKAKFAKIETLSKEDSLILGKIENQMNNDIQPVQIRFFNASGTPIFKLVNCYFTPIFPMNVNVEECFNQFPPKKINALKDQKDFNLEFFTSFIEPLSEQANMATDGFDYIGLVFWNSYMIKPSRKAVKELLTYAEKYNDKKVKMFFVNNHNAYLWLLASEEAREKWLSEKE